MSITLNKVNRVRGEVSIPGDKSISHRGVMFASIAEGTSVLRGFLDGADCNSTISCFRQLGIDIEKNEKEILIHGKGLYGLNPSTAPLYVGNSGTTMRLISGILAGQHFSSILDGDDSIRKRPMDRIIKPLKTMGANIVSDNRDNSGCAPLSIIGKPLIGTHYVSPVASAQVKSCVLLAGLYAEGQTTVVEPALSRNHTENMLKAFGADIKAKNTSSTIIPGNDLHGMEIEIPGDISSAAYWIAAGLIVPNSSLLIKNVNTNPTRAGIIHVAREMGGKITLQNPRVISGEDVADILVESSDLHGIDIRGDIIPTLIDELPMIAIMAAFAKGTTTIADAAELRVKESDRISAITNNLVAMGADIIPREDGMTIKGGSPLHGAKISTMMDHRIAMSFSIASLATEGETEIDHPECVDISYPAFFDTLKYISE